MQLFHCIALSQVRVTITNRRQRKLKIKLLKGNLLCFFVTGASQVNQQPVENCQPCRGEKKKNRQPDGGAVIPCSWILEVSRGMAQKVEEVMRSRPPDIEGHENMEVKVCLKITLKSNSVSELFLIF